MKYVFLNVIYYFAISALLIYAAIEYNKEDKKFISVLALFVAVITIWHGINNLNKPV